MERCDVLVLDGLTLMLTYEEIVGSSFHSMVKSTVPLIALMTIYIAQQPSSAAYSYGLGRLRTVVGFASAVFLMFMSFHAAVDSFQAALVGDADAKPHSLGPSQNVELALAGDS
eukprot:SAG31_NODE_22084_length_534_cov_0.965517_1_plen_113_part_10